MINPLHGCCHTADPYGKQDNKDHQVQLEIRAETEWTAEVWKCKGHYEAKCRRSSAVGKISIKGAELH